MGIDRFTENSILDIFKAFPLRGASCGSAGVARALMIGRPTMVETESETPESLFFRIGATAVDSLDASDVDGASIIQDMNLPVHVDLHNKYSVVFDNGTMEHCFDVARFLFNVHQMTAAGGLVIHSNPINNYVNHGFYQFSPCLFLAFYLQNNYDCLQLSFTGVRKVFRQGRSPVYSIVFDKKFSGETLSTFVKAPRLIFNSAFSPDVMTSVLFVARKRVASIKAEMPQQPIYSDKFSSFASPGILSI